MPFIVNFLLIKYSENFPQRPHAHEVSRYRTVSVKKEKTLVAITEPAKVAR
jgi:hypothetical protein